MKLETFFPHNFHWGKFRYLCTANNDILNSFENFTNFEKNFVEQFQGIYSKIPLPTTFHWQFGGGMIYVSGEWDSWQRHFPLCNSGIEYGATVPLFPGIFRHKYSVDGMLKVAPSKIVEDISTGNLINYIHIERLFIEKDCNNTLSDEDGTNHFRLPYHILIMKSCKTFSGTESFPSHQVFSINFIQKNVPEIYYLHKRPFDDVLIPFSNYLNHIFFPSLKTLNLDIFLKVPILPSKKRGKMFTNFFFGVSRKDCFFKNIFEKQRNIEKRGIRMNGNKIERKEKLSFLKNIPFCAFFIKCFG
jgi:hypothetical protein